MRNRRSISSFVWFAIAGCAAGGSGGGRIDAGPGTAGDAAVRTDASSDAGAGTDGGGRADAGTTTCPAGQHACGGGCIADLPNTPERGCRLGCGEPCPAPAGGVASCSTAGACGFDCPPPFRVEGTGCVCTPRTCAAAGAMCGALEDGCGETLDCGACGAGGTCRDGVCACAPDAHEPNASNTTATALGSYDDADDPDATFTDFGIDDAGDVDWMRFSITDGTDGGNPRMTLTLDQIPMGNSLQLSAFYACRAGAEASACNSGLTDNEIGHGCTASSTRTTGTVEIASDCDHLSTDDGGTLYVRVRATAFGSMCSPYRLRLSVR